MALKWLIATVTEGSADAFAEAEFATGLSGIARTAYRIRRIEWQISAMPNVSCELQVALRRNSSAAISAFSSQSVIAGLFRAIRFTTSGAANQEIFPNAQNYSRDLDLLIVEEALFLQIDSNATSAACSAICRIGVENRSITDNERLQILATSAQG